MPDSAGLNRRNGVSLTDWRHVEQSIAVILTTPIGTRVMRREFGSEIPYLIDRPMTPRIILAVYAATALALRRWEPRFDLKRCQLLAANEQGQLHLEIEGVYMPRGHLGDTTPANDDARAVIVLGRIAA